MANSALHGALPFPVKGARYTVLIPYLDADGDPTDPTTPDTEVSQDNGAFADCAEEAAAASGSNGMAMLTLTGAETNCSVLGLAAKIASGPKATLMTIFPRVLPVIFSGTASAGAAGTITVATDVPAITSLLLGCIVRTTGGTGGGGTGGANNQARVITGFTSGRVASVTPNWETAPDGTTTYEILLTEFALLRFADVLLFGGSAGTFSGGRPEVNATHWGGTAVASANVRADLHQILGSSFTEGAGGRIATAFQTLLNVASPVLTAASVNQTGDAFARLGAPAGASIAADIASTHSRIGAPVGASISADIAALTAFVDSEVAAILAAVDPEIANLVTDMATVLSRLSATRAGYLDNLSGGAVALASQVTSIQNNTRGAFIVPEMIERPDSGTAPFEVHLYLYDDIGNMEAPDSAPTLTLVNQAGTDLSARLDSTTMALVEAGHYKAVYTANVAHALDQLIFEASVVEGGATRKYGRLTQLVDTTAVDFTSTHATQLAAVFNKLPSKSYIAGSNNSDGDIEMNESTGDFNATQQARINTEVDSALDTAIPGSPTANSINERIQTMDNAYTAARGANLDNLDATVSSRATPAQVSTQVETALATTNRAESTAVPAANASLAAKISYLFDWRANRQTVSETAQTLRNRANSADLATASLSESSNVLTKGTDT